MNKKSQASTLVTTAIIIVLLTVIILAFFGEGLLPEAAKGAEELADNVLAGIKKDKFDKPGLETDKTITNSYENILSALRKEGQGPCIFEYSPLAKDFNDHKISLTKVQEGTFVQLLNKEGQRVEIATIEGNSTCVVNGQAAINFYNNYLDGTPCAKDCPVDYSTISIEFISNEEIILNNEEMALEDQNLAFKTKDGNVCFFPTYTGWFTSRGCDADETGLDNDCLEDMKNKVTHINFCK